MQTHAIIMGDALHQAAYVILDLIIFLIVALVLSLSLAILTANVFIQSHYVFIIHF